MPRYRFAWSNLPISLQKSLAEPLGITEHRPAGLSGHFGVRPKASFVQEAWPILLESWLSREAEMRVTLVGDLREYRLGRLDIAVRTKQGQMEYLRSCRNAPTLRKTVLQYFLAYGEIGQIPTRATAPATPENPHAEEASDVEPVSDEPAHTPDRAPALSRGPQVFNTWVAETIRQSLGLDELSVDNDGDIPVRCGSAVVFVRPLDDDSPFLHLFSPLLSGFADTPAVYSAVNSINLQIPLARAMVVGDGAQIVMTSDLLADGLTRAGLVYALELITEMADHFDTLLKQRFGGETMLEDAVESVDV